MFPSIHLFGTKIFMTGLGIVISAIVFLVTTYQLCKKYNQDFMKLFNWLPIVLISIYLLGLYSTFVLENMSLIPTSFSVFSPYGYHFGLIGILIAIFGSIIFFLRQFRRNENKKIWIDIFFFGIINAVIVLGIFLLLGDSFVGKECGNRLCVHALTPESNLVKFEGVYPIGLFLSVGALVVNILITTWKMSNKKLGLGIWGFILLLLVLLAILPFWNYPARGILSLGWFRIDLNHMTIFFFIICLLLLQRRWRKPF